MGLSWSSASTAIGGFRLLDVLFDCTQSPAALPVRREPAPRSRAAGGPAAPACSHARVQKGWGTHGAARRSMQGASSAARREEQAQPRHPTKRSTAQHGGPSVVTCGISRLAPGTSSAATYTSACERQRGAANQARPRSNEAAAAPQAGQPLACRQGMRAVWPTSAPDGKARPGRCSNIQRAPAPPTSPPTCTIFSSPALLSFRPVTLVGWPSGPASYSTSLQRGEEA